MERDKSQFIEKKMCKGFEKHLKKKKVPAFSKAGNVYYFTKEKEHLIGVQCCCDYDKFDFKKAKQISLSCSYTFALISTNTKIPEEFKEKLKKCGIGLSIYDVKTKEFTELFLADFNTKLNEILKNRKMVRLLIFSKP